MIPKTSALAAIAVLGLTFAGCSADEQSSANQSSTGGSSSSEQTSTRGDNQEGPTIAPDPESVGNFRPGPPNDEGKARTLVDFRFDQEAFLTGGNRTSFHLVPKDGGEVVDGSDAIPKQDKEGDNVVTVVFDGQREPKDFARGYVDAEVLSSDKAGDAPTNVGQAEKVAGSDDTSVNPDLVSVTRDKGRLLFEFDQPLTSEDIVQDSSGLQIYYKNTKKFASKRVEKTDDPSILTARYADNVRLDEAVGAVVTQGSVQGKSSNGKPGGPNAFDQVAVKK